MAQEQLKFLLINYSKTLGKYNRVVYPKQPEKTIKGNALITVPQSYIDEFNIPYSLPLSTITGEWKEHTKYIVNDGGINRQATIKSYERVIRQGLGQLAILRKLRADSSHLKPEFQLKKYYFRFPHFFNISMIDQALSSILQNEPKIDKFYFFLNNKRFPLIGEETGWGTATLSNIFIDDTLHPSKIWGKTVVTKYKVL